MSTRRLLDVGQPAERNHDIEVVTVAEHTDIATLRASCSRSSGVGSSVTGSMMPKGCHGRGRPGPFTNVVIAVGVVIVIAVLWVVVAR